MNKHTRALFITIVCILLVSLVLVPEVAAAKKIVKAPVAKITPKNTYLSKLGTAIQFHDKSTNNPTSWEWHFGDGTVSYEKNPSHAFTSCGTYFVTMKASNSAGWGGDTAAVYVATCDAYMFFIHYQ